MKVHSMEMNTLELTRQLIARPSVSPEDAGCLELVIAELKPLGFECEIIAANGTTNLWARLGRAAPLICFAGHTDVVPTGPLENWNIDPFTPTIKDGILYGRGASDMKTSIAAFVVAIREFVRANEDHPGSIAVMFTSDEEGPALDGTVKVVEALAKRGEKLDYCIVGEPTSVKQFGDMIKNGRRGSLTGILTVQGVQGHVAYPHRADNPVHRLIRAVSALTAAPVDAGTDWFEPSSLQITSMDVGNTATNVIPASARAALNIRFNDKHSGKSLTEWVRATVAQHAERFDLESSTSGESFVTKPGPLVDILRGAIVDATGVEPKLDTGGGTSDARFIANYCPVAEFGLVGATMHQTDERVPVAEMRDLARIYRGVIASFLA